MILLQLSREGMCPVCKNEFAFPPPERIGVGALLPQHLNGAQKCRGSGRVAVGLHPVLKDQGQATAAAEFLSLDTEQCLFSKQHSQRCANGRDCDAIRLRLAQAFARYYLLTTTAVAARAA